MATATKKRELDLTAFPSGTVTEYTTLVCLACIFDIFTKQLQMAPRTAFSEVKRHTPTVEELTSRGTMRPYFDSDEKNPRCPYCGSAKRWLARFDTYCIEGGKRTDAARRTLIKKLPTAGEQFIVVEKKSDSRTVFFEWLDTLGLNVELQDETWPIEMTRRYLERRDPKTNWAEMFEGARAVRRSSRLTEGWERDGARLFLAPQLYSEAILIQYLVSRSHAHGGLTLEGRLTLMDLLRRLRYSGYLDRIGITETDPGEVFERVVDHLAATHEWANAGSASSAAKGKGVSTDRGRVSTGSATDRGRVSTGSASDRGRVSTGSATDRGRVSTGSASDRVKSSKKAGSKASKKASKSRKAKPALPEPDEIVSESVKLYYLIDRRDFLEKVKSVYAAYA